MSPEHPKVIEALFGKVGRQQGSLIVQQCPRKSPAIEGYVGIVGGRCHLAWVITLLDVREYDESNTYRFHSGGETGFPGFRLGDKPSQDSHNLISQHLLDDSLGICFHSRCYSYRGGGGKKPPAVVLRHPVGIHSQTDERPGLLRCKPILCSPGY